MSNHKRFIWQFELALQAQPFWQSFASEQVQQQAGVSYEQRFFWSEQEVISLAGLTEKALSLASYQIETKRDIYLLNTSFENIKLRKHKLHIKQRHQQLGKTAAYHQKQKHHISKDGPFVQSALQLPFTLAQDKRQARQQILASCAHLIVDKEALLLETGRDSKLSIEFARIQLSEKVAYSLAIESLVAQEVTAAVAAMVINKAPQTYPEFLQGAQV